jgi:hypothetical protein
MEEKRPVVWITYKDEECALCRKPILRSGYIVMDRAKGIRCLICEGLDGLEFLAAGNVAQTRRALARSRRSAIVVKYSRARHRNERQGVLVEEDAIGEAYADCEKDAAARDRQKQARRVRDEEKEAAYIQEFSKKARELFPGLSQGEAEQIAVRACEKYSGRVGRTAAAKALDDKAVTLGVRAHVRHSHTEYDRLLAEGRDPGEARRRVRGTIEATLERWRHGNRS